MKTSKKPLVIILMGPPGSGKGTQAELLAEKLDLKYIETAKVGEERIKQAKRGEYIEVEGKKYYFAHQKRLWLAGKLWDPPFISRLMEEKIEEVFKAGKNLVLAGSPRTLYEGEKFIPLLKKLYGEKNIKIIFLEITAKESIWRNSHRRICQLLRHPIIYTKETAKLKICPLDGSRLIKRKGLDTPEIIKIRLKEYQEKTFPLIDYFKREKLKVIKINGSLPPALVFENIISSLNLNNDSFKDRKRN